MSTSTSPASSPGDPIAAEEHCEAVVRKLIRNLAAHDADRSSWGFLPPSLRVEWLCHKPAPNSRPASTLPPDRTLQQWLDQLVEFWTTHPDHHVRLLDVDTVVSPRGSSAVSYFNVATSGRFPGVTAKCVCAMTFQHRGEWEAVHFSALTGLAPSE